MKKHSRARWYDRIAWWAVMTCPYWLWRRSRRFWLLLLPYAGRYVWRDRD